jgi:hypothetical protein
MSSHSRAWDCGVSIALGDNWDHDIAVERRMLPHEGVEYPRCIAGERACPPEDCGGPWEYLEFLAALDNPDHGRHEDFRKWCGGFDPAIFNLADVSRALDELRENQKWLRAPPRGSD